ncbi:hypothetical protein ACLB2K_052468 [Fragaria x ananassa]
MFVLASKLRTLKQRIRVWNKIEFGDVNKMVEDSFVDLDRIQQEIASLGPSEDRLSKESVASAHVHVALALQEKFFCDKSRVKWLTEGDSNTFFFHAMVKVRQLKQSLSIMRDGGYIIDDPKDISDHVVIYFKDLFIADSAVRDTGLVAQDLIKAILGSAHLSILINGATEGFFTCPRGVRQGDPLSPILFCLAEEVLSRGISKLVEERHIDLLSAPLGITPPSHVLFADDIMVFMRGTKHSLKTIMHFMEEYGLNSGQQVNKAKSLVFLGKYAYRRCTIIRKILGVRQESLPFTYLGVPIFQGRPKRIYFQAIADRVRCKLSSWKGSLLSQAGRLHLIQLVIQGILVYSFQIYEWPKDLLLELQSWIRNFNWTGDPLKIGIPLVAWRQCCKSKEEGGLGLRDLFKANRALLVKRCWDVLSSSSPASVLLRARFLKEDFQPLKSYKRSSVWLGLKKVWPTFFNSLQWCVGDGRKISFWLDNWMGKPLASSIGVIGFIPLHAKVNEFIVDSHWALPAAFTNLFPHVTDKINRMTLPIVGTPDSHIWPKSSSGALTTKEAFVFFSSHIDRRNWGKVIWSKTIQPRKSLVVWKALHGRLLTDDALQRRGFSLPSCCSFCGNHVETGVHLLLHCPRIVVLWKWVCLLFNHSFSPWSSLEDVFLGAWVSAFSKQKRMLWIFIACTLIWYIWITRNLLRFEGKVFDALDV